MSKLLNQLVTGDNFINEDENDYIYASLSKPPLKIISKNGSMRRPDVNLPRSPQDLQPSFH